MSDEKQAIRYVVTQSSCQRRRRLGAPSGLSTASPHQRQAPLGESQCGSGGRRSAGGVTLRTGGSHTSDEIGRAILSLNHIFRPRGIPRGGASVPNLKFAVSPIREDLPESPAWESGGAMA